MLFCIAYLSSSAGALTQADLDEILVQSRRNNGAEGITGALLFNDGNFFQVLEGPKEEVEACFARILNDRRHTGCTVLRSEPLDMRSFSTWDMAFIPFEKLDDENRQGFIDLKALHSSGKMDELQRDEQNDVFVNTFLSSFRTLNFA